MTESQEYVAGDATPPPSSAASVNVERVAWMAVIVAGLGYFVDVFDMWLFSNFRVASLRDLGLQGEAITTVGATLLNYQLAGFLVGGFIWGMLGDRRGRASVMFGSIFLYSTATLLNAFVTTIPQYAALRFIGGLGLAGEIGAGITLVSELLPRHRRGWGTTFVTSLGVGGAIGAAAMAKLVDWKTAYVIGGLMGFALLFLRIFVHESGLFGRMRESADVKRGSLLVLLGSRVRALRYLGCIVIGAPIYAVFTIFVTFAPEFGAALGIREPVAVADVMFAAAVAMTVGDFIAGAISQMVRSRKLPIYISLLATAALIGLICFGAITTPLHYTLAVGGAALFCGYWACLITLTAEQFGTNVRATATTTVPNLIRASGIISTSAFISLKAMGMTAPVAGFAVSAGLLVLAMGALLFMRESYSADLDFVEH